MTALSAFDLLLVCVRAKKAGDGQGYNAHPIMEKDKALQAVIDTLVPEIRRILTPTDDENQSETP